MYIFRFKNVWHYSAKLTILFITLLVRTFNNYFIECTNNIFEIRRS